MSAVQESQAARYGAEMLMTIAGTLAETAEGELNRAARELGAVDRTAAMTAIAAVYAQLAQAAAIQEAAEAVAGTLADVVGELGGLNEVTAASQDPGAAELAQRMTRSRGRL